MTSARDTLLTAVVDELDRNGLGDRSLRDIAAAVGTSHRMLIHHFGSREGMLVAVVDAVESAERSGAVESHAAVRGKARLQALRATWRRLVDPSFAGRERLFFECYARGLQGEEPFRRMHPASVEEWLASTAAIEISQGVPPRVARARSRMMLALYRGLLLDLLATADRQGVDDAFDAFCALLESVGRRSS